MPLFKPFGQEFFQTEIDALAEEHGKRAEEIEWVAVEDAVNGVAGRWLQPEDAPAPAKAKAPDPVPEATVEPEAAPAPTEEQPAA